MIKTTDEIEVIPLSEVYSLPIGEPLLVMTGETLKEATIKYIRIKGKNPKKCYHADGEPQYYFVT